MANYRKSFSFRNGVQIDTDNFIVNENGLVGIGTTNASDYLLSVYGDTRVTGLTTSNNIYANQSANVGVLTVRNGANITGNVFVSGALTATTFYGSAAGLTGFYAVATDGWYIDSANSGIFTSFKVGIGTTNPQYSLQIGSPNSGEGIYFESSTGNIFSTGNISCITGQLSALTISGDLDASNLSGTIDNARLPNISVGIITATTSFFGNLTGTASVANSITPTANIQVNSINSGFSSSGISTVSTTLHVSGNLGVGTQNPNSQIHVRKSGISSIQLTSDGSNSSTITFGRSVNITSNSTNGQLRFGNTSGSYPDSTQQSVDIINYDTGNLNFYLNPGGSGTGSFNWFKSGISKIMTLSSSGNLGINSSSPSSRLSVVGDVNISGVVTVGVLSATNNSRISGILTVTNGISVSGVSTISTVSISTASINSIRDKDNEVGSSNQVLTSTGSQIDWKNLSDLPLSGKIIQIVSQRYTISTTHNTIWQPTGLSIDVTPISLDSKILILVNQPIAFEDKSGGIRICRNAGLGTESLYNPGSNTLGGIGVGGDVWGSQIASIQIIDEHQATGVVTYYTEGFANVNGTFYSNSGLDVSGSPGITSATSQIYAIEIS